MLVIDGSYLEGGGQILRTACSLSALTGRSCHIFNIRRGRARPGLMTQHLVGIRALSDFCGGTLAGARLGSQEISFRPGRKRSSHLRVVIHTAGSITLVLQALMLPALSGAGPVTIEFRGGATDTHFAPSMDYFMHVLLRMLGKLGVKVDIYVGKRGYYPKGGAEVTARIKSSTLRPPDLTERGRAEKMLIFSAASKSLRAWNVAERQAESAKETLAGLNMRFVEKISYYDSFSPGSSICLVAEYGNTALGYDGLGKPGMKAEDVGKETALGLVEEIRSGACIDSHFSDQILPFMSLGEGKGVFTASRITNHCRTNMWVIEQFLSGRFSIEGNTVAWNPA